MAVPLITHVKAMTQVTSMVPTVVTKLYHMETTSTISSTVIYTIHTVIIVTIMVHSN